MWVTKPVPFLMGVVVGAAAGVSVSLLIGAYNRGELLASGASKSVVMGSLVALPVQRYREAMEAARQTAASEEIDLQRQYEASMKKARTAR